MSRPKPACQDATSWVRGRLARDGYSARSVFASFTGQDASAFAAFVHLLELYVRADEAGRRAALVAMRATLWAMQPASRSFAKKAIPWALDWGDEEKLWARIGEPDY